MKRLLSLLVLALVGCFPEPSQLPYRVTEVQIAFPEATERWAYFYGEPQALTESGRAFTLTPLPQASASSPWAVAGTLAVNGEVAAREVNPPARPYAQTTRAFPGVQFVVRGQQQSVLRAWVFDTTWSRLRIVETLDSGERQVVENAPGTPAFENLSPAETEVILREVLARRGGRPVVLYEIQPPLAPLRYEPGPTRYTTVALAVQYGLETELLLQNPEQPPKVLLQGARSAYGGQAPLALLAADQAGLEGLWQQANGLQIPPPAAPSVSFAQSRVAAFFWGQKNTGGYSVQLVNSRREGATLQAVLRLSSPGPGSITTQALTSPFLVLEVPASVRQVVFVNESGQTLASAGG